MILSFGKFRGSHISTVPDWYFERLLKADYLWPDTRRRVHWELKRRQNSALPIQREARPASNKSMGPSAPVAGSPTSSVSS